MKNIMSYNNFINEEFGKDERFAPDPVTGEFKGEQDAYFYHKGKIPKKSKKEIKKEFGPDPKTGQYRGESDQWVHLKNRSVIDKIKDKLKRNKK